MATTHLRRTSYIQIFSQVCFQKLAFYILLWKNQIVLYILIFGVVTVDVEKFAFPLHVSGTRVPAPFDFLIEKMAFSFQTIRTLYPFSSSFDAYGHSIWKNILNNSGVNRCPSQFIIHNYHIFSRHITYATDKVSFKWTNKGTNIKRFRYHFY
jgi:hypothetical protein